MVRKTGHDGDCAIYSALVNNRQEDGRCNCGYGLQELRKGNPTEMCSEELKQKLRNERLVSKSLGDIIEENQE